MEWDKLRPLLKTQHPQFQTACWILAVLQVLQHKVCITRNQLKIKQNLKFEGRCCKSLATSALTLKFQSRYCKISATAASNLKDQKQVLQNFGNSCFSFDRKSRHDQSFSTPASKLMKKDTLPALYTVRIRKSLDNQFSLSESDMV